MLTVVKVGGRLLESGERAASLAQRLVKLPGSVVVVHGGGPEITAWQERLGIEVEWRDGLRVTSPEGMRVTAMVLSGWMNKRLVSAVLDAGGRAVGLSGEDGGLLEAKRKSGGALGEVGQVVAIDIRPLELLLGGGLLPVVSPVSRGPEGAPLNVNGDEAAIAIAGALGADRLLLLSDVPGVLVDGRPLSRISGERAESLVAAGTIAGGMQVKVAMALDAARRGTEVRIGDLGLLGRSAAGTRVEAPDLAPNRLGLGTAARRRSLAGAGSGREPAGAADG